MSSNLVIAQDTEVTITGVYVNSSLGANQEAYCKMQYRVQQSVTEERLVRPGEAPPKSYTPLTALSSMRPPNDQSEYPIVDCRQVAPRFQLRKLMAHLIGSVDDGRTDVEFEAIDSGQYCRTNCNNISLLPAALATPPLFGPPSQCDSPLGLGPRAFYPPPTSSSGSSSAFCAPIPHGSPGEWKWVFDRVLYSFLSDSEKGFF